MVAVSELEDCSFLLPNTRSGIDVFVADRISIFGQEYHLSRLSTAGDRVFGVAAPQLWNSLPACVTSATTLSTFKKHLKTHLFNQSYIL